MDIQEKQARWALEKPLFEAEFIHSHLLQFFNFNENTGDYEIKSEFSEDEDKELAFEVLNTGGVMWLRAKRDAKAQAVSEGFVLVKRESLAMIFETATNALVYHAAAPKHDALSIIQGIARKAMIEAQEQVG
ncbi:MULTISPECIES: hypothetical protein [unclassified Acinetobacter]|uniref:hypothetical protein n=1 Tax=unclassified Acinetobacter TaxID=196816 RepID=UPI002934F4A8|nr:MULTISPECIES: hypothetical protein [unclassified Acinetobacter]WOE32788.1 hypothetical protein QSG84_06330 [Acinetobacter sp. SAAs470]WOE38265.1 hypothetical protein QSG86_15385 [Acinetobacter sp. SAAs474]